MRLTKATTWKFLFYDHQLPVKDNRTAEQAAAFRAWHSLLSETALKTWAWVDSFLSVAARAADQADSKAAKDGTERFAIWVTEGSANGLKRQHLFSKCATGWVADQCEEQQTTNLSELDDLEGIPQEQLRAALLPNPKAGTPVGAQYVANVERVGSPVGVGCGAGRATVA